MVVPGIVVLNGAAQPANRVICAFGLQVVVGNSTYSSGHGHAVF